MPEVNSESTWRDRALSAREAARMDDRVGVWTFPLVMVFAMVGLWAAFTSLYPGAPGWVVGSAVGMVGGWVLFEMANRWTVYRAAGLDLLYGAADIYVDEQGVTIERPRRRRRLTWEAVTGITVSVRTGDRTANRTGDRAEGTPDVQPVLFNPIELSLDGAPSVWVSHAPPRAALARILLWGDEGGWDPDDVQVQAVYGTLDDIRPVEATLADLANLATGGEPASTGWRRAASSGEPPATPTAGRTPLATRAALITTLLIIPVSLAIASFDLGLMRQYQPWSWIALALGVHSVVYASLRAWRT